jgi:hypothetical protein
MDSVCSDWALSKRSDSWSKRLLNALRLQMTYVCSELSRPRPRSPVTGRLKGYSHRGELIKAVHAQRIVQSLPNSPHLRLG